MDLKQIELIIGMIVNTITTHMSRIYVGKDWVAKEFLPVNLGFTDLTSVEARREAAHKTAEIDTAYCPFLESRVVEICGIPFIVMRKFDPSKGLDRLYDAGAVTLEHARQIGVMFARAHKRAKTDAKIAAVACESIAGNWEELFFVSKNVAQAVGRTISEADYSMIMDGVRKFIARHDIYFQERRDSGVMRQCHGDGHAGNMFVQDGEVMIFDGIGFKDAFSYMDPISDLAFAVMDAIKRGRKDIAEAIVSSYIAERPEDAEGVAKLLGFYVCYRAFVRGQVSTMIANSMPDGVEKEAMLQAGQEYYGLAKEYLPRQ